MDFPLDGRQHRPQLLQASFEKSRLSIYFFFAKSLSSAKLLVIFPLTKKHPNGGASWHFILIS
jgi:hypothetical protein